MHKRTLILLVFGFCLSVISSYAQEEITVTTYYPSPYGSYQGLEARRMVIGTASAANPMPTVDGLINFQGLTVNPAFSNDGTLYYNSTTHTYQYYNGTTWSAVGGCIQMAFTNFSGYQLCPVGTAVTENPGLTSAISGFFLCCSK